MKRFLKTMYALWFALVFALSFLLFYPLFAYFLAKPSRYLYANKLRKIWARLILILAFIRLKITGDRGTLPPACILVANHSSYLDILSMALIAPPQYLFMAKAELAKIPLFGIFFRTVDIAVNRQQQIAAAKAYKQCLLRIQAGYSLVLFPEGTIGKQAPKLKPFKEGAFKLAIDNKLPLVVVSLPYNFFRLSDTKGWQGSPGTMEIIVHPPLLFHEEETVESLKSKVYRIIEHDLATHSTRKKSIPLYD
jgi:1-acyl-sn-glycerol-3-phosphate acyltransferase